VRLGEFGPTQRRSRSASASGPTPIGVDHDQYECRDNEPTTIHTVSIGALPFLPAWFGSGAVTANLADCRAQVLVDDKPVRDEEALAPGVGGDRDAELAKGRRELKCRSTRTGPGRGLSAEKGIDALRFETPACPLSL